MKQRTLSPAREDHILVLAVCLAIAAIDATHREMQAGSDQEDMKLLLDQWVSSDVVLEKYVQDARRVVAAIRPASELGLKSG